MEGQPPQQHEVPLSWIDFDETPIMFANQFLVQAQPHEFVLSIGQATPPPLIGTPEQIARQAAEIAFVPVRTLTRVGFTRGRLVELISALQANLENHDRGVASHDPRTGDEAE